MDRLDEWRVFVAVAQPAQLRRRRALARPLAAGRHPRRRRARGAARHAPAQPHHPIGVAHRRRRAPTSSAAGSALAELRRARGAARAPTRRSTGTADGHRAGAVRPAPRRCRWCPSFLRAPSGARRAPPAPRPRGLARRGGRRRRRAPRRRCPTRRCARAWSGRCARCSAPARPISRAPACRARPMRSHATPASPSPGPRRSPIAGRFPRAGGRERSVPVRARLIVNTGQAAIDAAVAGLGIVRVLSYQVARLVAASGCGSSWRRSSGRRRPIHLVHLPGVQPRAAAAFLELATQRLRAAASKR